jgi:hypothetical protein
MKRRGSRSFQNWNFATIWPLRGAGPAPHPANCVPPFSQFTKPNPDDSNPGVPLKLYAKAVGVLTVVAGPKPAAPFEGTE